MSRLRPLLGDILKIWAPKHYFPDISLAGVQLHVFTPSDVAANCPKTRVVSSLPPGIGGRNISFRSLCACVHDLLTSYVPLSFLITTGALTWLFGDGLLYLFMYSILIFYGLFNFVTLDSGFKLGEFKHQSRYCIHFWTNAPVKAMNPIHGLNRITYSILI